MAYEVNNTGELVQRVLLNEFREREVYSVLPIIVVDDLIVWTGKWFKRVKIKEQKYKIRYSYFDDGWSYMNYWDKWKINWQFEKIIK